MIPFRPEGTPARFPLVTLLLLAACVAGYAWQVHEDDGGARTTALALVPAELTQQPLEPFEVELGGRTFHPPELATLLSHAFLHASLLHLLGNMVYLWAFGGAAEAAVGSLRFAVLYLLWGAAAALGQVIADPASPVPMVGASGAISGVLGAFIVFYPLARVRSLFFVWVFPAVIRLPSVIFIGVWVGMQILYARNPDLGPQNVAYWAHLAGFGAGLVSALVLRITGRRRPDAQSSSKRRTT